MNCVQLIGNLTRDPDFREGSTNVCKFSIATTDGYGDKETVSYPSIVVFGKQAENCAKYLTKGSKVGVMGRIQTGSYERDGRRVYTTDVVANRVEFLSSKGNSPTSTEKPARDENRASDGYQETLYDDVPF